ncbi:HAD family hydrolase [Francisella tularensis subsp. novicida]|uniref:5'-nucleotidase, lipoprotein e(P4) family n=1 Tax=Francisella tularensis TaxID=263 RepID=UPI00020BCF4C|nr:5'-nucleotidase, lipoprotein e(P4) family [Francisella tularensis]AEE87488.1 acid phosphatase, HAD superfamily protein [Francisella cf. novicida Fx1]APA83158.1 Acid phosphatase [Francisella tularensis subsp. novicida PA10-7858]AVC44162.1 HAD family hydrolase [Francisella tularensis subsp. novicida]
MNLRKIVLIFVISIQFCFVTAYAATCNSVNIDGVKWYHDSDEKRAIYLEIYNLAAHRIKHQVKKEHLKKGTWGVILDIDETALDNSWLEYDNYKNYSYSEEKFRQGIIEQKAKGLPGAAKLTNLVHKLGGYVSFVSNRYGGDPEIIKATEENLTKEDIYYDQILFYNEKATNPKDKNSRFEAVKSGKYTDDIIVTKKLPAHAVIAYFGDNIQDFPQMTQKNMRNVDNHKYTIFGEKYYIFPNPMYGSWQ